MNFHHKGHKGLHKGHKEEYHAKTQRKNAMGYDETSFETGIRPPLGGRGFCGKYKIQ
jgi:hypothetical protein